MNESSKFLSSVRLRVTMYVHSQLRLPSPCYPSIFAGLKAMTNAELFGSLTPNECRFCLTQILAKTQASGKGYQHAMGALRQLWQISVVKLLSWMATVVMLCWPSGPSELKRSKMSRMSMYYIIFSNHRCSRLLMSVLLSVDEG